MQRRQLLGAGIASMALSASSTAGGTACTDTTDTGTFVLVHGASHGGWCWHDLAFCLRRQGYQVFTPTLTGMGARQHLSSPDITLGTHIEDVVNLIRWEELEDIILVAHSYGGTVITGVSDELRERVAQVIFVDANTPRDGEPTIPGLTRELAERVSGQPLIDGYLLPPMDPARLGIDPGDTETTAWLKRRLTTQPLQTLSQPISLKNGGTDGLPRTFILTTPEEKLQEFAQIRVQEIKADPTWDYRELLVGHEAMILAPDQLSDLLVRIARQAA